MDDIQMVFDYMQTKGHELAPAISWGDFKKKYPMSYKMTEIISDVFADDDDIPDDTTYKIPYSILEAVQHIEDANTAEDAAKYFKCFINIIIDVTGELYGQEKGLSLDEIEGVKLEAYGKMSNYHQAIDGAAEQLFTIN
jgi:hypothetical protein